jgi:hypothetical protein
MLQKVSVSLNLREKSNSEIIMTNLHPFKWRHFQSDIILLCVRWYKLQDIAVKTA